LETLVDLEESNNFSPE